MKFNIKQQLNNILNSTEFWIFFFALALIHGVSFQIMDAVSNKISVDAQTYLGLANFDFDQSPVRKYRVIIPFLASAVNFLFGGIFQKIAPWSFDGDFGISMSFLIVNNIITAYCGVLVYKYIRTFSKTAWAPIIGLVSFFSCRWVGLFIGIPSIESLYWVVVMWSLLAIQTQNVKYLMLAIFIGPWAKESFIFIAPLLFFFVDYPKWKQLIAFAFSGLLVFSARYIIDLQATTPIVSSLQTDVSHFENIVDSLKRLFSFHGFYEIFSVVGFWFILLIPMVLQKRFSTLQPLLKPYILIYIGIVLLHALLSTELARMFVLALPILAVAWVLILEDFVPRIFLKSE